MKQVYPNLYRRCVLLSLLLQVVAVVSAQDHFPIKRRAIIMEKIRYIAYAPVVVPNLVSQQKFDSLGYFLFDWQTGGAYLPEIIFPLGLLSAIETRKTAVYEMPSNTLYLLSRYADMLSAVRTKGDAFRMHMYVSHYDYYDASKNTRKLVDFIQQWASRLQQEIRLDPSELFFCRVLTGEIRKPRGVYRADPASCPSLQARDEARQAFLDSLLVFHRGHQTGTFALSSGVWMPNGHLQTLGIHPFFGFSTGVRNKWNEYDLSFSGSILPAANQYAYVYLDTMRSTRTFVGGMLGLSYTRFLIHRKYWDAGVMAELGYDFFQGPTISDSKNSVQLSIGTLSYNGGVRCKYFFRRWGYLGLMAKYHLMRYNNGIGTDLTGNAWTVELNYGSR